MFSAGLLTCVAGQFFSDVSKITPFFSYFFPLEYKSNKFVRRGTAVAQWLRYCATNWKVAGSIPDGVFGVLH